MTPEQLLKEIEDRLLKLDNERVSLLREIQTLRNEIAIESKSKRTLLGRPLAPGVFINSRLSSGYLKTVKFISNHSL